MDKKTRLREGELHAIKEAKLRFPTNCLKDVNTLKTMKIKLEYVRECVSLSWTEITFFRFAKDFHIIYLLNKADKRARKAQRNVD